MTTFRRRLSDLLGLTVPEPEPRSVVSRLLARGVCRELVRGVRRELARLACQCGRIHTGLIWTPGGLICLSCAEENPRAAISWEPDTEDPRKLHGRIAGQHIGYITRTQCGGWGAITFDRDGAPVTAWERHRADAEDALLRLIEEVG